MVCADRNLAVAIDDLRPTSCESLTRKNDSSDDKEDKKPSFHSNSPHIQSRLFSVLFYLMRTTGSWMLRKVAERLLLSPPDTGGDDATSRRSREASFNGADGREARAR